MPSEEQLSVDGTGDGDGSDDGSCDGCGDGDATNDAPHELRRQVLHIEGNDTHAASGATRQCAYCVHWLQYDGASVQSPYAVSRPQRNTVLPWLAHAVPFAGCVTFTYVPEHDVSEYSR